MTTIRTRLPSLDHGFARFLRMSITGAIGASILNLLAWLIAEGMNGTRLLAQPFGTTDVTSLTVETLLMLGVVAAIGAALLYWILDHLTNSPMLWLLILSVVVLVGTYFGPASLPIEPAQKMWLQVMHFTTAAGIIWAVLYVRGWFPILERR